MAAGVTWTSRTAKAEWAARTEHTSAIDAAGAIYVIGGYGGGTTPFQDVWASTDGGARPDYVGGWVDGVLEGVLEWVLRKYSGVLRGSIGGLRSTRGGTTGVLRGYYRGLEGYEGDGMGVLGVV